MVTENVEIKAIMIFKAIMILSYTTGLAKFLIGS